MLKQDYYVPEIMVPLGEGSVLHFNVELKMLVLFLILYTVELSQGKAFREEIESRGKRYYSHDPSAGLHQTYDPQSNAEHWMKEKFYEPQVDGQPIYVPAVDQQGSYNEFLDAYYKAYTPASNLQTPKPQVYSPQSEYKTSEDTSDKDANYISPVPKESLFSVDMNEPENSEDEDNLESDYDDPEIVDKTNVEEFSNDDLDLISTESNDYDPEIVDKNVNEFSNENMNLMTTESEDFEQVSPESFKNPGMPKTKPKEKNYDQPNVVKAVKQKPKTVPKKQTTPKTKPQSEKAEYNQPAIIKTVKQQPKKTTENDTPKKSASKTKPQSENVEYDEPTIVKTVKQKPKGTPKKQAPKRKTRPQLENSEYDQPDVVRPVKQRPKTTAKKQTTQKTRPQYDDENDYEKPVVDKANTKPNNKQVTKTSTPKYGDRPTQETRKKSKGKRRKQYSKSKPRVGEVVDPDTLDPKTTNKNSDLSESELYPPQDSAINVKDKTVEKNPKRKPSRTNEKVVVKNSQYDVAETKKVAVQSKGKTRTKSKPTKVKETVVKTDQQYQPVKSNEKVATQSNYENKPTEKKGSVKYTKQDTILRRQLDDQSEDSIEMDTNEDNVDESNSADSLDTTEREPSENKQNSKSETNLDSEGSKNSAVMKPDSILPNTNDFRALSSMNSNIWSMLFNPNAEQNRLKQKRCITRSNETGFCTYIQNCEVPHIATSLDQLLNNACVIDDIFIGVCCPEFPVESVKVHWDHKPSDFDNQIEDEFGHNAEGELIKSWCDGYEESLTNLLISFSLADCGIRSNEALELQSWPWKAPLVSMSNGKIFCGGVIISEDHVLTAAHCTTKIPKNQILVRLGQYDDGSGDDYAVVEIKRHAQYNPRTMQNDVALLKLGRRIMNDAHIGIVCLPEEDDTNDHDGETATLLGWRGIFGTKSRDPEFLKVISNKECEDKLGSKVPDTLLCTDTRKESERTCNADSGAPLVIEHDGRYEIIGILSWNRNDCNQRFPSTFSRVSAYTGWIKNHIA